MPRESDRSLRGAFTDGYAMLFGRQWAAWVGGILLALVNIMMFAYEKPWSTADGARNWGDWLFNTLNITDSIIISPHLYSTSILNFGVIAGAFAASLLARQFRIQGAPPYELLKGLVGGSLMGVGAAMAFGCNIGGFFSATSALSMAGLAMMVGLMTGAYIGLRLLMLEVTYINTGSVSRSSTGSRKSTSSGMVNAQPIFGVLVLLAGLGLAFTYDDFDYPTRGGFLLFGLAIGVFMQRTRFCFVRAFREPFLTGDAEMTKAVVLAVVISVIGFSILKWTDLREWDAFVSSGFWFGSLVGGIIFGVGMSLSGGCASGTLWRAGEGQIKLWVVLFAFAVVGSWFRGWLEDSGWLMKLGTPVFLPDFMSWKMAILLVIGIMSLWYLLVAWNEVKRKLVVAW